MTTLPPAVLARLRVLHAHVCPERGQDMPDCTADEDDPHEADVCASWDAIRDAHQAGRESAFEEAEAALIDHRWPYAPKEAEMVRRATCLTIVDAIRAAKGTP